MLGYYRRQLTRTIQLLRDLEQNADDLDRLLVLQRSILVQVLQAEKKKSEHREKAEAHRCAIRTSRLSKAEAAREKRKLLFSQSRIEAYQKLAYFLRCLGDGIAFTYISKWNLKPLMFDDKTGEQKCHAGHLGGKTGLLNELALVVEAIKCGVPAILCDLTNISRHGDVCLLGGDDPHVIEVKSSGEVGARGKKQQARIDRIHDYFEKDEGKDVRGAPFCQRVNMAIPEVNHILKMNCAIDEALSKGVSKITPEPGIHYIAISTTSIPDFAQLLDGLKAPHVYLLNQAKDAQTWGAYYPFTLSIRSPDNLFAFLEGSIYVMVVLDWADLEKTALDHGYEMIHIDGPDWVIQIRDVVCPNPAFDMMMMSKQYISRIAFEFVSWKWMMAEQRANTRQYKSLVAKVVDMADKTEKE